MVLFYGVNLHLVCSCPVYLYVFKICQVFQTIPASKVCIIMIMAPLGKENIFFTYPCNSRLFTC